MVQGEINRGRHTTIRLGTTPSGLTSAHLHYPAHIFLRTGCPSCHPTNSVKALKPTSAFCYKEKTREFSSTVLPAPSPYLETNHNNTRYYYYYYYYY